MPGQRLSNHFLATSSFPNLSFPEIEPKSAPVGYHKSEPRKVEPGSTVDSGTLLNLLSDPSHLQRVELWWLVFHFSERLEQNKIAHPFPV